MVTTRPICSLSAIVLLSLLAVIALSPYETLAISVPNPFDGTQNPFSFRVQVGPDPLGFPTGDIQSIGVSGVTPPVPQCCTVVATQGGATVNLPVAGVGALNTSFLARIP